MADYYDMMDKKRRAAQAEQATKFRTATGNDPYAAEIIAGESRVAAPPPATPSAAPKGSVRGVPEEMTAEYRAPYKPAAQAVKPPVEESPLYQAVRRVKKAHNELARLGDERKAYIAAGAGIGGAIGAGLSAPTGPFMLPATGLAAEGGAAVGGIGRALVDEPLFRAARDEKKAADLAVMEALRSGAFSQKELEEALAAQNLVWNRGSR